MSPMTLLPASMLLKHHYDDVTSKWPSITNKPARIILLKTNRYLLTISISLVFLRQHSLVIVYYHLAFR